MKRTIICCNVCGKEVDTKNNDKFIESDTEYIDDVDLCPEHHEQLWNYIKNFLKADFSVKQMKIDSVNEVSNNVSQVNRDVLNVNQPPTYNQPTLMDRLAKLNANIGEE